MGLFNSKKEVVKNSDIKDKFDNIDEGLEKLKDIDGHKNKVIEVQKEELAARDRLIAGLKRDIIRLEADIRDLETLYNSRKKQLEKSQEEVIKGLEYKGKYLSLLRNL